MDDGQITIGERSGVAIIALSGEHDLSTATAVGDAVRAHGNGALVVDLVQTTFLDSSILGVLVAASRGAGENGTQFSVVLPTDARSPVRRIFDLTGLDSAVPHGFDVDAAIEAGRKGAAPTA